MENHTPLADARREIDRIDGEISRLLAERFRQVARVAEWKKSHGQPVFVPEREEEIIRRVRELSGDFCADDIESIFRAVFAACRRREERQITDSEGK